MSYNNTVAIISNNEFTLNEIKNMLVLLRDIDKVECFDYYDADELIKKITPNVIILHSTESDKNCLRLLKKIRSNEKTKNIPVILYPEFSNTDYIVEAFDNGISDILTFPLKDYELVIRVIWAIQKNEQAQIIETKDNFLAKLGIIDSKTGFYKEDFSLRYLESVVSKSKTNKQKSCLVLIKVLSAIDADFDKNLLKEALKSSIRINDTIAMKDENTYYLFLSKAKLNGVYSVYERILSKLGPMTAINASVVEIQDEIFDDIINVLEYSIEKAPKNGEMAVVSKQDFLDMYKKEEKEELGISKLLKDEPKEEIKEEEKETKEDKSQSSSNKKEEDKISLGIKIMQEKVKEIETKGEKALLSHNIEVAKEAETKEIDERNATLYKQAYAKKLRMIVEPLLEKYAAKLQGEYPLLDANVNVSPHTTFMNLDKDDVKLNFEMAYDGIKTIKFNIQISALNTELEADSFELDVMEFNHQALDVILKTAVDEYKNYLSEN